MKYFNSDLRHLKSDGSQNLIFFYLGEWLWVRKLTKQNGQRFNPKDKTLKKVPSDAYVYNASLVSHFGKSCWQITKCICICACSYTFKINVTVTSLTEVFY